MALRVELLEVAGLHEDDTLGAEAAGLLGRGVEVGADEERAVLAAEHPREAAALPAHLAREARRPAASFVGRIEWLIHS